MIALTKFLRVPVGQTFDRLRLALPFRLRRKVLSIRKRYPPLGFSTDSLRLALLLFRKEKCYAFGKKFTEDL